MDTFKVELPKGSSLSPSLYNIYTHDFPEHHTVSTCLFADDSAMLSQGTQLKYTLKNMQNFLVRLQDWLTQWRIAINVDKSQAIIFRKWGVIDPPFQLTLFDDQFIQNKILRLISNAPWYVRNDGIHYDLHMEPISSYITKLARNVFRSIENHDNPIIRAQTMFPYPHPKLNYAYATAKWQIPLKPP
ncbi:RNA-directed DNA polymerase from mobile element jockey [Trichonephila clavipes]|nr:RNA-directed DNA polymerase from mobile element jockey [Trichonephila clavipes]